MQTDRIQSEYADIIYYQQPRPTMKLLDAIIRHAENDPEYLEGISTMVLTGFMAAMVIILLI